MSWPSGLSVGQSTRMTLSRMVSISGSFCADSQLVGQRNGVLGSGDFARVQATIDMHDDFCRVGKFPRLRVREALGGGKLLFRRFVLIETGEILRRGDNGDFDVAALGCFADDDHLHAIGVRGQLVEVVDLLLVIREIVVVAGRMAEHGDGRGRLCLQGEGGSKDCDSGEHKPAHESPFRAGGKSVKLHAAAWGWN